MPRYTMMHGQPEQQQLRNVHIMSSYAHRDTRHGDRFTHLPFQGELLRVVTLLENEFPGRFCFRWRPHPADDPIEVQKAYQGLHNVELSSRSSLQEDVEWADILISCFSSAIFESLMADAPIFLHLIPDTGVLPIAQCFDASRTFFWAEEIVRPFSECIHLLDARNRNALAPERRACRAVFGADASPHNAQEYFTRTLLVHVGYVGTVGD